MKLVGYVFARKIKTQNMTCKVVRLYNTLLYEGWNFNSGNYLFTTDTK